MVSAEVSPAFDAEDGADFSEVTLDGIQSAASSSAIVAIAILSHSLFLPVQFLIRLFFVLVCLFHP
jgi:hypothetical protein